MKFYRRGLRLFIAGSSLLAFLGGWVIFAHTEKPAPTQPAAAFGASAPLDLKSLQPTGNLQPLPRLPSSSSVVVPRLRTRSS